MTKTKSHEMRKMTKWKVRLEKTEVFVFPEITYTARKSSIGKIDYKTQVIRKARKLKPIEKFKFKCWLVSVNYGNEERKEVDLK